MEYIKIKKTPYLRKCIWKRDDDIIGKSLLLSVRYFGDLNIVDLAAQS